MKPFLPFKGLLQICICVVLFFNNLSSSQAQNIETFTTPGSFTWIAPPGVTSIKVETWGGGGAGGGSAGNQNGGSGGGGGGYQLAATYPVVPGTSYSFIVGNGGGGVLDANGGNGTSSSFNSAISATGGTGGFRVGGTAGTGGGGLRNGGIGALGASNRGGGGGGAAGTNNNGANGSNASGGNGGTVGGGAGGNGSNSSTGQDGANPGGGGGGAGKSNASVAGGNGGKGQVVLTYTIPPLAGIITVGTGKSPYVTTITNAISLLNSVGVTGPVVFELENTLYSGLETFPLNLSSYGGASATNTVTFRPKAGTAVAIQGSLANTLIDIKGSSNYYIFDGLNTGGASLTVSNTSTSTSATTFSFSDGAQNNILRRINIFGSGTSNTNGTIYFKTTTGVVGNSYNTITGCNIGPAGSNTPRQAIYSLGTTTTGRMNINNTISNCNIYDFFSEVSDCSGIFMGNGTSDWTISGNSFYLTNTKTITTNNADWNPIKLFNTSSGVNTLITGNFIGGNAPLAASGMLTINGNGAFKGISIRGALGTKNIVSNNVIKNIDFTTSVSDICSVIYHTDGNLDIINNQLGSQTALNSIYFRSTMPGTLVNGVRRSGTLSAIFAGGAIGEPVVTSGSVLIDNNQLGGISCMRQGLGDVEFRGIDFENSNCNFIVSNNTVGGTIAGSILNNSNNSTLGIIGFAGAAGFIHAVTNNTVQNILSTLEDANSSVTGITAQGNPGGTYNVSNNTIKNLTGTAYNPGFLTMRALSVGAQSGGQVISGNNIDNINQVSVQPATITGISFTGGNGGGNIISKNKITAINSAVSGSGGVYGLDVVAAGSTDVYNNMIVLGYDGNNASTTANTFYLGMLERASAGTQNIVYNSIHIGGAGVNSATSSTYTLYSTSSNARLFANNLLANDRQSSGTAINYGYYLGNTTSVTSTGNNIYSLNTATSATGRIGGTVCQTISAWRTAFPGQDLYSVSAAPTFFDEKTDLRMIAGGPTQINFLISNEGVPVPSVTTVDYFGTTRNAYTPDVGFHEYICRGCWVGNNSITWNVAGTNGSGGNWEDGVIPDLSLHAKVMNAPNQPTITNPVNAIVKDLYLKTPGYITLANTSGGKLQVNGNFNNRNGWINGIDGTLEMNGAIAQSMIPNLFVSKTLRDLIISNQNTATGVTLNDSLFLVRSLTFGSAGQKLTTNDQLTLRSTNALTAFAGDLTGKTINGKAIIERYLRGIKAWRFIATPVQISGSPTVTEAWRENASTASTGYGTQITGPAGFIGMDQQTLSGSMKSYNATTNAWSFVTNTSATLANDAGYMVFVRGDRAVAVGGTTSPTNLRIKGSIRQGNQVFNVAANKFQSIGNPFPAEINFATVTLSNVADQFTTWNPASAGLYGVGAYEIVKNVARVYTNLVTGATNVGIASGQAFFVQSNSPTLAGTVTIKETDKSTGSTLVSRAGGSTDSRVLFTRLQSKNASGIIFPEDGAVSIFGEGFSKDVDNDDAVKFLNSMNNLGITHGNAILGAESRPEVADGDTIFLRLAQTSVGDYRFQSIPVEMNKPGLTAYMVDKFLNTNEIVSLTDTSYIDFSITNDAGSKATDRFLIVFKLVQTLPVTITSVAATRNTDKTIAVKWSVENELQITRYEVQRSADGISFTSIMDNAASGAANGRASYSKDDINPFAAINFYRIKAYSLSGKIDYSSIVKVHPGNVNASIAISPNPVVGKKAELHFNNQAAGEYTIQITNSIGQLLYSNKVKVSSASHSQSIILNTPSGGYQLQVIDSNGASTTQQFILL